ncbi:MAG: 16S rRNA (guanine(966)-N(2))-methyltransferase RsmD [Clostridia bacterium]|nr:16S rRNA (guanine(966)-N(2))-methyltransferase RsmD [Clostridia bacterium]
MMRIITGTARGIKLTTLEGETTRPTAERVKEAVFSMIQFEIEGRAVLDLFAGSGQLALEALSRGAARATIIDASREAANVIMDNAKKTRLFDRCRISCADYASFIRGAAHREQYDIVFLDPPYAAGLVPEALRKLAQGDLYAPGAVIVCETDNGTDARPSRRNRSEEEIEARENEAILQDVFGGSEELAALYTVQKSVSYGRSRITLLRPVAGEA